MSQPHDPRNPTIRLIDQRQRQVLEDLDRLNERILEVIQTFNEAREDSSNPPADELTQAA